MHELRRDRSNIDRRVKRNVALFMDVFGEARFPLWSLINPKFLDLRKQN
jgi:hypothetical protein